MQNSYKLNDNVIMKKPHACQSTLWKITRVGVDIKLKCLNCGREIMLDLLEFEKKLKKVVDNMNEIVLNHPLITHKLAILRDVNTGTKEFRELVTEISTLLCYEATKDAKLEEVEIETPLAKMQTGKLNEDNYAVVPILRAGMGMVEGIVMKRHLSLWNTTTKCLKALATE